MLFWGITSKSGKLEAQNLFIGMESFGAASEAAGLVHRGGFTGVGSYSSTRQQYISSVDKSNEADTYISFSCMTSEVHPNAVNRYTINRYGCQEL
jgi:hypothetical protein